MSQETKNRILHFLKQFFCESSNPFFTMVTLRASNAFRIILENGQFSCSKLHYANLQKYVGRDGRMSDRPAVHLEARA